MREIRTIITLNMDTFYAALKIHVINAILSDQQLIFSTEGVHRNIKFCSLENYTVNACQDVSSEESKLSEL